MHDDKRDQHLRRLDKIANIILIIFLVIVVISFILFLEHYANAKDFGVIGKVNEIKEKDAVEEIKSKLMLMKKTGVLAKHEQTLKEKVTTVIQNPPSLNIPVSVKDRVFTYDPSIIVREDLKDENGVIFHHAGTRVNPLDTVSMPYQLVFFDATNKKQLEYALKQYQNAEIKPRLILTGGSPVAIEQHHGLDVYFDQHGVLVTKLGIKAVPAIVWQSGSVLLIKEVNIEQ